MSQRDPYWDTLFDRPEAPEDPPPEAAERRYRPIQPEPGWKSLARKLVAPFVAVGLLFWKFKFVLAAIFKFKIFTTAGSMLVSFAGYALWKGWAFGLALVLLLLVHELGHVLELRRQGVPASAPLFIPFLGAVVGMKRLPDDAWKEARVALAGPIVGSLGAAALWGAAVAYDSEFLKAMAFVGFFINLFNLLPIVPLDGGRAVAAVHPAIWGIGLAGLIGLAFVAPNPILLIIILFGGIELWNRWHTRHEAASSGYYRIKPWQRAAVGGTYLGLIVLLALASAATFVERDI